MFFNHAHHGVPTSSDDAAAKLYSTQGIKHPWKSKARATFIDDKDVYKGFPVSTGELAQATKQLVAIYEKEDLDMWARDALRQIALALSQRPSQRMESFRYANFRALYLQSDD